MATYLITGANRGIGAALAQQARTEGHHVISATRQGQGGDVTFDVTDPAGIRAALATIKCPVDVLINNAGIMGPDSPTVKMDWDAMARTYAVNAMGPLAVSAACVSHLCRSSKPRILTISSQMSWMGYAKSDWIAYRASKAAVNKIMQGLATDLRDDGICVALVDPGWVQTDMGGLDADLSPQDVAAGIVTLAEGLTLEHSGKFFKWSGVERAF